MTLGISWDHSGAPSGPYPFRKDPRICDQTVGFRLSAHGWWGGGQNYQLPQGYYSIELCIIGVDYFSIVGEGLLA